MEQMVQVTPRAAEEVKKLLQQENQDGLGLRLGVQGGGCSGLSYKLGLDFRQENDHVVEIEGLNVYLDRKSALYLKGVTLDYNDGLDNRGFKFINPNAQATCGCGDSFSV